MPLRLSSFITYARLAAPYVVVGLLAFFGAFPAHAASVTSNATGNWSGAATSAWPLTNRTGNATSFSTSTAVSGVGTFFTTELTIGNVISAQSGTAIGTVLTIIDDTHLTLNANASNSTSGVTYRSNGVGPGDSVTIASGHTVTMDVTNATVSSLTFAVATATNTLTLSTGKTLNITNALTFTANTTANAQTVTLNGTANLNAGSIVTSAPSSTGGMIITCAATATGALTVTNNIALVGGAAAAASKIDFGTTSTACGVSAGSVSLTGGAGSAGLLKLGTGTLTLTGTLTGAGTAANAQLTTSGAATISLNNGTIGTGEILSIAAGTNLTSVNASTVTYATAVTTWGALNVNSGILTYSGAAGTFTSMTIAGSANLDSRANLITNTGNYTLNGTYSGTGGLTMTGNSTIDGSGTYSNTGIWTLSTAAKAFAGTANLTISAGTLAISGVITATNNGIVTITSAGGMTGSVGGSTWLNAANSTLNISGPLLVTGTLTATANPNLINYNGVAQALKGAATHFNVNLSGSGAYTGAVTTISGSLTTGGSVSYTTGANLTIAGNLSVSTGTTLTTGANFTLGVTGVTTDSGTIANSNTGAKTYTGNVIVNAGGVWTNANNSAVTFGGGFINNSGGALTMGTGTHTFSATQSISGGNTITFGGVVAISGAVTVTNNSTATLVVAGAMTGTVGGSTWLQAANSTLNVGAAVLATGALTATASPNTVNYTGAAPALKVATYDHLNLSGSGPGTGAVTTINSDLTTSGTVNWTTGANLTVGGQLLVGSGSTLTTGANFTLGVTGVTSDSGTIANTNTGAKTYTGRVIVNANGVWTNATNSAVTFGGGFINNSGSVLAMGTGTHTFNATQSISGGNNITFGGVVAISGAVTVTNTSTATVTITGNLTGSVAGSTWAQGNGATLSLGAAAMATGVLDGSVTSNTVTYTGNGTTVSCSAPGYYDLNLSPSGASAQVLCTAGGQTLTVLDNLIIGDGTNAGATGATNNPALAVTANVTIAAKATMTATSGVISIGGTFNNSGIFSLKGTEPMPKTLTSLAGSTVTYTATSGTVPILSTWTYRNLVINGAGGTFATSNVFTLNEGLTVTAGTLSVANSTMTLTGTVGQGIAPAGATLGVIIDSNTTSAGVIFTSNFTATSLYVNGAGLGSAVNVLFNAGGLFAINTVSITGAAGQLVSLHSTTNGSAWQLNNTGTNSVSYADARDSDARLGTTIDATNGTSVNTANNVNWNFGVTCGAVTSSKTGNWSSSSTWDVGYLPTSCNAVTVASGHTVTMDLTNPTISSLTFAVATAANTLSISTANTLTVTNALTFTANTTANPQTIIMNGTANLNAGSIVTSAPSSTGGMIITCAATATGTLGVTNNIALIGGAAAAASKIDFGTTVTACNVTAGSVSLTGGGTSAGLLKLGTGTLTLTGMLTGAGTVANAQLTTSGVATISLNNGTIGTGETLSIAAGTNLTSVNASTVTYATAVTTWGSMNVNSGILTYSGAAGTFTSMTIAGGATLDSRANLITNTGNYILNGTHSGTGGLTMTGNSTIDGSGTYSNTGIWTLSTAAKAFAGTANLTISAGTLAISGVITATNNGVVTINSVGGMTGSVGGSTWLNAANSTLNISGPLLVTGTLTATANPNTVNYSGAAQALKVVTYYHLTLSGSGTPTGAITTISGMLTSSTTVTYTTGANLAVAGNLSVGAGTTITTGANFTLGITGTTAVYGILANSNTGAKTYTGLVTLYAGSTWTNANNSAVNFAGGFTNASGSAVTMGSGTHTFTATQSIIGGNTITFGGIVAISGAVTVTNASTATIVVTGAMTGTVGGSTWLQSANSTLNVGAAVLVTGTLTATALPNLVNYTAAGQAIKVTTYDDLTLSGSGLPTGAVTTINSDLALSGTVNWTTGANMTVGASLTVGAGTTLTTGANFTLGVTGATSVTGILANSNTGAKTYTGAVTINPNASWMNANNSAVTFGGGFNNYSGAALTMGSGTHTFNATQTIDGGNNITFGGIVAISGAVTVTNISTATVTITGNLTGSVGGSTWAQGNGATLAAAAAVLATGTLDPSVSSNTVIYTGAGQTIKVGTYDHLTLSGSGAASGAVTTINSDLTLTGTVSWTATANLNVSGNLTLFGGTFDTSGSNFRVAVTSNVTISGGTLNLNASSVIVSQDWAFTSGAFNAGTSTVTFSGAANSSSTLSGASTFNGLACTTPRKYVLFTAGATTTVGGVFTSSGTAGNPVNLKSTVNGTGWVLRNTGSNNVSFVSAQDSDARTGMLITCTNTCTDAGNNKNWNFGGASVLRTWWGAVDSVWSNSANWDTGAPIANRDSALIVSTATRMPTLTASVSVSTISIVATSSLTLNGFNLSLSSFTNAGSLVLQGIENITTAPNNVLGSSVIYSAPSGAPVIYSTWTYANLFMNGNGSYTPTGNLTINQALTFGNGQFLHNNTTINFTGTSGTNGITTGGDVLYNVTFNGAGGTWIMQDSMTLTSNLTLSAGTLDTKSGATNNGIAVGGEWLNNGATFLTNNSSITFTGSGSNLRIRAAQQTFWKLLISGSGSWITDTNSITVSSTVLVNSGSLTVAGGSSMTVVGNPSVAAGGTLDIEGDMLISGGSLANAGTTTGYSTATLTLTGAGIVGGTGSTALPGLTLTGAVTTTLAGPVFIKGTLNNPATHTLDTSGSNYAITMGGNWSNLGIFTPHTSSVTFNGSTSNGLIATNLYAFYNLSFNGGTWRNMTNTVTVSSSMHVNGGTFNIGGSSLTVTGSIDVNAGGTFGINNDVLINGGSFTNSGTVVSLSTPTVTLAGAGVLGGAGSTALPILTMTGAATTTLGGPLVLNSSTTIGTGHTLDVSASNYQITISSWFANNGTFTAQSGTVVVNSTATITGSNTFYNFTSTTPGITITLQAGTTQFVTNVWSIAGGATNKIKFRSTTAAGYTFRVSVSSFVAFVDVQNCYASSQTIYAGKTSTDGGSNTNWVFDFPPNAVAIFTGTPLGNGDVQLSWNSPLDNDDNPLAAGSQYAIQWATYTAVVWSTSTIGDTSQALTYHFFISTSAVSAGTPQVVVSTGLGGNIPYYFQIWTKDPTGIWSQGLSVQATATPVAVLGITLTAHSYDFGSVNMTATTISTSAVTVGNVGNVTETYSLSVATTGPSGVWGVSTSTPTTLDHFVLFGGFNSTAPSASAFVNIDALTNTPAASTGSKFAIGQNGVSTPLSSTRDLWLRLDMPPTTSTSTQQQMTVTVTATTP